MEEQVGRLEGRIEEFLEAITAGMTKPQRRRAQPQMAFSSKPWR